MGIAAEVTRLPGRIGDAPGYQATDPRVTLGTMPVINQHLFRLHRSVG